ncbi:hypothetical protein CS063_01595 [Sporanaerobium hydrogeniformans]|uniref:Uncharacterized protein n=1 Tax=Sporanaerobium hydrogeniformans TaxID=3072179 RepID=A0AC61DG06_9FIRM|nr:hypothetical protein [Sporanaerobium hydrogeniformans]PHV72194.1 hypothetical protein CS063_01595 [Sporanaerobium hydrogeniformans]
MSEALQTMVKDNIFTRIGVAAVEQRTQSLRGMQELVALYLAMGWINAGESAEILAYAQQKLVAA